MISGTGIDIVEVRRMKEAIDRWGDAFLTKVFTSEEIRYANSRRFPCQHFAARFAAKEATVKALGDARKAPFRWTDIEVLNDKHGKPEIVLHDKALAAKKKRKITGIAISLSHSKDYAIANAILLNEAK